MRRKHRRRRLWIIPLVLALVVLIGVLLLRFVFVVRNVEVQGISDAVSPESVVRTARVGFGTSVFSIDEDSIRRRIDSTGNLKLEGVDIRYPHTVRISVRERSRAAMVLHMGKIRVLDEDAYVIESVDEVPDMDLIYVSGLSIQNYETGEQLRADSEQIAAYCAAVQAIKEHAAGVYVSELMLENPDEITIITRTGITVELGDASNMSDKIAWMKSAVADLEGRGESGGTLDVRSGTKADYRIPVKPGPTDIFE